VQRMTLERDAQSMTPGEKGHGTIEGETVVARPLGRQLTPKPCRRDPAVTLRGCQRILILGRTGSGKTTLGRELAAAIGVPHVELDALYFGPNFCTAPLSVLRERTSAAMAGDRWVTDGNKSSVRDLVWPRADTIIWLEYPLIVSLWRLGKRALWRTSVLKAQAAETGGRGSLPRQFLSAAKGVLTALRSHSGQRREYPRMFAEPENQHLAVVRLRSPRATRRWLARATGSRPDSPRSLSLAISRRRSGTSGT
jgi:energy-coupling factor transporter ATP-binding protein EcfA2